MNKSVFITRRIPEIGINLLKNQGYRVDIYPKDTVPTQRQLIKYLKRYPYDAVICLLTDAIDSCIYDAVPTAKIFATYTVGFNNIDIQEAKKRGIIITNTAGAARTPVAEHTVALMLGLTTRMVEADAFTRKGKYKGWTPMSFIGTDLTNTTVGLIGTGQIGSEVARMVHNGFGARIFYYDIVPNQTLEHDYHATRCQSIEEILQKSEIISIHVPLMKSTWHLLNDERIRLMKPTSILINTSRGAVIDEQALIRALQNNVIRGAGLDVYEFEPHISRALRKLPNVILTPHIASAREKARNEMAEIVASNIIDYLQGRVPKNIVNP